MPVKTEWKFNETFKEIFLDIWYELSKPSFTTALEACDKVGNEMIIWLSETNIDLYKKVYAQALKETQEEIMARGLD